jgi:catechol 2,3-dioxygenase-like lactoylglutathione lyase family enzyme
VGELRKERKHMLENSKAFSGFAVDDVEKAKKFYGETLGLNVSKQGEELLQLDLAGDRPTLIYPKPDFTPATYTVLNFPVDDIDATVEELTSRGVTFEQYAGFDQDEKGVSSGGPGPKIAWFKDPAGNILSVLEADPSAG